MNHITALAIAKSIQQDRLDAAEHRRSRPVAEKPARPPRRTHFGEMARVLLMAFRRKPQPTR